MRKGFKIVHPPTKFDFDADRNRANHVSDQLVGADIKVPDGVTVVLLNELRLIVRLYYQPSSESHQSYIELKSNLVRASEISDRSSSSRLPSRYTDAK